MVSAPQMWAWFQIPSVHTTKTVHFIIFSNKRQIIIIRNECDYGGVMSEDC